MIHQTLAVLGLAAMLAAWVAVQRAWRRAFGDGFRDGSDRSLLALGSDPDALAARGSCGEGCGCVGRRLAEACPGQDPNERQETTRQDEGNRS